MKKQYFLVFLALVFMIFAGCATKASLVVTKPAEVNLSGVKTLSILDFDYTGNSGPVTVDKLLDEALNQLMGTDSTSISSEEETAQYARNRIIQTLTDTKYFNIVETGEFKESLGGMTDRLQFFDVLSGVYDVDAVMLGSILKLTSTETTEMRTKIEVDEETDEEVEVEEEWTLRNAELEMEYKIIGTLDSQLIVHKVFTKSRSDSKPTAEYDSLLPAEKMHRSMIDDIVKTISRQLVPYQVTETRSLMKDKMKDARMENADKLVKVAKYREALDIFLEVWDSTKNIAAGFNAAIMYEAIGDLDTAIEQMDSVLDMYPEKKVFRALERLKAAREEREKAIAQMAGRT